MTGQAALRRAVRRGAEGFTLVELLIVLALLGGLTLLLTGVLRFGVRAWESGTGRATEAQEIEVAHNLLRRLLSQARLLPVHDAADGHQSFLGERERLRFVAPLPPRLALGGFYVLSLELDEDRSGRRLLLGWRLYRPDETLESSVALPAGGARATRLLARIETVDLAYFGAPEPDHDAEWLERWDRLDALPQLVRVRVGFHDRHRRSWPDLVVAPMAADRML